MNNYMTKRQFDAYFKAEVMPALLSSDNTIRRTAYNDTADHYRKAGIIGPRSWNWSHPRWLEGLKRTSH